MMSLSPVRFCYRVSILNNPSFTFSFQSKSCQILPFHSATSMQFPHQTTSKQRTIFESHWLWVSDIETTFTPGVFSLPFSALQNSFVKYVVFIFSAFCVCKSQCLLVSLCKIWTNLPAHPSSWKKFHMLLPRDWQSLPSQTLFASVQWSLCLPLMTPDALNSFVGQKIFKVWALFVSVVELQWEKLLQLLWDLLKWQIFEARIASFCLHGSYLSFTIAVSRNNWQFFNKN